MQNTKNVSLMCRVGCFKAWLWYTHWNTGICCGRILQCVASCADRGAPARQWGSYVELHSWPCFALLVSIIYASVFEEQCLNKHFISWVPWLGTIYIIFSITSWDNRDALAVLYYVVHSLLYYALALVFVCVLAQPFHDQASQIWWNTPVHVAS